MVERSAGGKAPVKHAKGPRIRFLCRQETVLSLLKGLSLHNRKKEEDKLTGYSYSDKSWAKYSDEAPEGQEYDDPLERAGLNNRKGV